MTSDIRTLYIVVTNALTRCVYEHQSKQIDGFTKKYNVTMLAQDEVAPVDFRPFAEFILSAVEGLRVTWFRAWQPAPKPKPLLGTARAAMPDLAGFTMALV